MDSDFDLTTALRQLGRVASPLASAPASTRNRAIEAMAAAIEGEAAAILEANTLDLETMRGEDVAAWELESLKLTPERLHHLALQLRDVAELPDPIGVKDPSMAIASNRSVAMQRIPLGAIALAYEVYPEWCLSGMGMAIKTGNSIIVANDGPLQATQDAMADIASTVAYEAGIPEGAIQAIPSGQTEHFSSLLRQSRSLKLVLACGRKAWVESIADMAAVMTVTAELPQILVYLDVSATWEQVNRIILQHPCLPDCRDGTNHDKRPIHHIPHLQFLLHADWARDHLEAFLARLQDKKCMIQTGDILTETAAAATLAKSESPASSSSPHVQIETVADVRAAIAFASSSDARVAGIVTDSRSRARQFARQLGASAIFINQFPDVAELAQQTTGIFLGWGSAPLSARGIIDFRALTAVKYLAEGD